MAFTITIVQEAASRGVVASGTKKVKGSSVVYEWEVEALTDGTYQLYINGDNENIDFKSIKECRDYVKRLADSTAADMM